MRLPRTESDAEPGGAATEARPQLLALLPDVTRATTGLHSDNEVFDGAMRVVAESSSQAMVLTRPNADPHMEVAAMSMGGILMKSVRALLHNPDEALRFRLSKAPTLRRAMAGLAVQELSMRELAREFFALQHADRIAELLGGKAGHAVVAPIRRGHNIIGAVVVIGSERSNHDTDVCAAVASTLSASLTFARVLRHVERVRTGLPHAQEGRRDLRAAIEPQRVRLAGQRFFVPQAGADPSLVPYRLSRTTAPPPSDARPPSSPLTPQSSTHGGLEGEPAGATDSRASVLIVEDERRLRESTAALLSGLGYRVEAAASGEEAVAMYKRAHERTAAFDVVLLDETLGKSMSGTQTLRMLRSIADGPKAILLSGLADRASPDELRRQGFFARLAKPVSLEDLAAAIEHALGSSTRGGVP